MRLKPWLVFKARQHSEQAQLGITEELDSVSRRSSTQCHGGARLGVTEELNSVSRRNLSGFEDMAKDLPRSCKRTRESRAGLS